MKLENEKNKNSFVYALTGIKKAIKSEKNIKIDIVAAILVIIAAAVLKISTVEWIVCLVLISGVLSAEMMNTAIEAAIDLYTREKRELAAKAKDVAAGAVLVKAIVSAVIGGIIFIPKIIDMFS